MQTVYNDNNVKITYFEYLNQWIIQISNYNLFLNDKAIWLYHKDSNSFVFDINTSTTISSFVKTKLDSNNDIQIVSANEDSINSKIQSIIKLVNFS